MSDRAAIKTDKAPGAVGPYSQAIESAGLVFISGQLPIDMATGQQDNDKPIGEQARYCLNNVSAIAKAAGTDIAKAVKLTVFLTDMSDFAEVNETYASFFPGVPPARSCFAVAALPKDARIEIEAIIAK